MTTVKIYSRADDIYYTRIPDEGNWSYEFGRYNIAGEKSYLIYNYSGKHDDIIDSERAPDFFDAEFNGPFIEIAEDCVYAEIHNWPRGWSSFLVSVTEEGLLCWDIPVLDS